MSTSPPCGSREGTPNRAPLVPGWSLPAAARRGSSAVDGRLASVAIPRPRSVPSYDCVVPPHGTSPAHKKNRVGKKGPRVAEGIPGGAAGGRFRRNPRWRPTCLALVLMSGHHRRGPLRGAARAADRIGMDRDITRHWSRQRVFRRSPQPRQAAVMDRDRTLFAVSSALSRRDRRGQNRTDYCLPW
jgi:hypothetical protein